jgi:hypothetical protein
LAIGSEFNIRFDENLIRCNLTPAQEASAIARRKAIYEQLHPETLRGFSLPACAKFAAIHDGRNAELVVFDHRGYHLYDGPQSITKERHDG